MAAGLRLALTDRLWEVETTSSLTAAEVVARADAFRPQCVLLDIHLGHGVGSGIELIAPMVSTGAHVVVLTAERRRSVLAEFIEAGAACWISKSAALDDVDIVLSRVIAGDAPIGRAERLTLLDELRADRATTVTTHRMLDQLTEREALVLGALIDGFSAEEIAEAHFVALSTVRSQIRAVLQKLGVRSQLAAAAHRELLPRQFVPVHTRRRTHPRGLLRCDPPVIAG